MRRLSLIAALLLATVAAARQSAPVQQRPVPRRPPPVEKKPSPAQPIPVNGRPAWAARGDTEDAQSVLLVGLAQNASESEAKRLALAAGIDKGAARLASQLFADPSNAAFYGLDALRQYVQKIARVTTWSGKGTYAPYEACALVQINKPFLQPALVRQYVAAPVPPPGTALGHLVIPSELGATSITRRIQVRMAKLRDGNFYFYFNILQGKNMLGVRLDQIQVLDDGSPGKTKWTFDVTIAGRPMLNLPLAEYTDDVVTYRRSDKPFEYALRDGERVVEVKVTGSRTSGKAAANSYVHAPAVLIHH